MTSVVFIEYFLTTYFYLLNFDVEDVIKRPYDVNNFIDEA